MHLLCLYRLHTCLYLMQELSVLILLEAAELVQLQLGGQVLLQEADVLHRGAEDRTLVLPHVPHLLVVPAKQLIGMQKMNILFVQYKYVYCI